MWPITDKEVWTRARAVGLAAKKIRGLESPEGESFFSLFAPKEGILRTNLSPQDVLDLCYQYQIEGTISQYEIENPIPPTRTQLDVPCVSLYA